MESSSSDHPPAMAKLKIAGAWSGAVEFALDSTTVQMLRAEVARRSGGSDPARINLICGGKVLKDGESTLLQLGVKNNGKVLATLVADASKVKAIDEEAKKVQKEEDHAKKLTRIREAAKSMAQRHSDGSFPLDDYNIELEDQNGEKIKFGSESDRRALMMGLMLHANAKCLIKRESYKDALDVLTMAEEAFSLCDQKFVELIDNVPILQLDTVWCYFMTRDISCLTVAGQRLASARLGFEKSHGKDSNRFRVLQSGRNAQLALYLRLELLEGVVAYHNGNLEEARKSLSSAQAKYMQLQVPDEALCILMGMGYKERAAKQALRLTGQDVQSAVDFLVQEKDKKDRRREENLKRRDEIMEQKKYGRTASNKAVDMERLNELASIGFERYLVAEALRMSENDTEQALDILTDPDKNCALQSKMESRRKRKSITTADIDQLASMGYDRATILNTSVNAQTREELLNLLSQTETETPTPTEQGGPSSAPPVPAELEMSEAATEDGLEIERDAEMEDELASELRGDALEDYDLDVAKEGEAICEYLSLMDSVESSV
ncbi:hypothetical protein LUZ60_002980 [Juncus effusus]|nr:hypothetical protein LUZ60_002980 [Juncus effusus]